MRRPVPRVTIETVNRDDVLGYLGYGELIRWSVDTPVRHGIVGGNLDQLAGPSHEKVILQARGRRHRDECRAVAVEATAERRAELVENLAVELVTLVVEADQIQRLDAIQHEWRKHGLHRAGQFRCNATRTTQRSLARLLATASNYESAVKVGE